MTAATYLDHVTLTTGHSRRSPRSEVSEEVVSLLAAWLDRALLPDDPLKAPPVPLPVPELQDFTSHVFTLAGGLIVTVYGPDILTVPPAAPEPIPLVTFAVARRSRGADKLWDTLLQAAPGVAPPVMPRTPWVAVVEHPTEPIFPDAVGWLGDFERCVAWAWIERVAG
ncbi:hypothetical protein [Azospirillum picis]|uniref:Uncharacterized protein n=1 Tax=Azospirillum picis TaxID=488438 RepID=A0ABU0MS61_9PROT|nr:hypothetical protein [Azospirillum picis]MBP2302502.1 hypothetical protein [Azospirillum picis]MDQ0536256.1 hypothetical protein [Azospirillum picis]